MNDRDFVNYLEDGTQLNITFEIKLPLSIAKYVIICINGPITYLNFLIDFMLLFLKNQTNKE